MSNGGGSKKVPVGLMLLTAVATWSVFAYIAPCAVRLAFVVQGVEVSSQDAESIVEACMAFGFVATLFASIGVGVMSE